jgi:putative salt-induced outer membrane protein YdiY
MQDTTRFALVAALLVAVAPTAAFAQDAVEQLTEEITDEGFSEDATNWNVTAGAVLSTGNTESLQLNAGTNLEIIRGSHGFTAEGQYILGLSGEGFGETTAEQLRARARYDFYFTRNDAVFVAAAIRRDEFAGLDPRLQGQIGYLRNFYKNEDGTHRFWGEIGYDLTFDTFDYGRLNIDPMMLPGLPEDQVVHAARLFVGYDNHIDENLTYKTGVEALFNVEDFEDFRLNWDNALRTKVGGNLQAELKFTLALDTQPVEGAERLDTITTLNLIYTLMAGSGDEAAE